MPQKMVGWNTTKILNLLKMLGKSSKHILPNGGFNGDLPWYTSKKKSPTKLNKSKKSWEHKSYFQGLPGLFLGVMNFSPLPLTPPPQNLDTCLCNGSTALVGLKPWFWAQSPSNHNKQPTNQPTNYKVGPYDRYKWGDPING